MFADSAVPMHFHPVIVPESILKKSYQLLMMFLQQSMLHGVLVDVHSMGMSNHLNCIAPLFGYDAISNFESLDFLHQHRR